MCSELGIGSDSMAASRSDVLAFVFWSVISALVWALPFAAALAIIITLWG